MFTGQSTAEGATKNLSRLSEKTGLKKKQAMKIHRPFYNLV